ncbi:MAG TPA: cytochrome c [Solirubrobacterales bacterium]|nr:cytochrome c [Solirubrobacterales bacterium]
MPNRLRTAGACLATVMSCVLVAVGCSGGSDSATVEQATSPNGAPEPPAKEQPLSAAELHGRDLFVQHCGSCHTLAAAGTIGQIGPDLGDIAIDEADIIRAIRTGGGPHSHGAGGRTGNMPRNLVTGKDLKDVVAFVAASASGSSTP